MIILARISKGAEDKTTPVAIRAKAAIAGYRGLLKNFLLKPEMTFVSMMFPLFLK
jgi:hypothetical protein